MPVTTKTTAEPPEHLSETMRQWWRDVLDDYELEPAQLKTLQLACEAFDRSQWARESMEANGGPIFIDRFGSPKTRPEADIARHNASLFTKLTRELCLDIEVPEASRLPRPANRYS
jgi:phage terminase small subunit